MKQKKLNCSLVTYIFGESIKNSVKQEEREREREKIHYGMKSNIVSISNIAYDSYSKVKFETRFKINSPPPPLKLIINRGKKEKEIERAN